MFADWGTDSMPTREACSIMLEHPAAEGAPGGEYPIVQYPNLVKFPKIVKSLQKDTAI